MEFHRYLLRQILLGLGAITLVICFTFILFRLPSILWGASPISIGVVPDCRCCQISEEILEEIYAQFGLVPDPDVFDWIYMFGKFVASSFAGKFGISFLTRKPVSASIADCLPNTMLLMISSIVISFVYLSVKENSSGKGKSGRWSNISSACPVFWIGGIFLLFGGYMIPDYLGIGFPEFGTISYKAWNYALDLPWGFFIIAADVLYHLLLPVTTLVLFSVTSESSLARLFSEVLKGSGNVEYSTRQLAMESGKLLTATILVEVVFTWRGLGRWFFDIMLMFDFPALQGCFIVLSIIIITITLFSDLILTYVNEHSSNLNIAENTVVEQELIKTRLRMFLLYRKRGEGGDPPQVVRGGDPFLTGI